MLVAVMLLNKTAGKLAIPIFWKILGTWGTPETLSEGEDVPVPFAFLRLGLNSVPANPADIKSLIQPLGLHETRSKRMIELSKAYIADPPRMDSLHPTKAYLVPVKGKVIGETQTLVREKYPPTPISHLPGSGPYALDSYRIFCMPGDHWKTVMPADKELIKYMVCALRFLVMIGILIRLQCILEKWKWALFEQRHWDPVHGELGPVDANYLVELPHQVTLAN